MIFLLPWKFCYNALLKFWSRLFRLISTDDKLCRILQQLGDLFPTTLISAARLLGIKIDDFIQFTVCPLCHSVYNRGVFGYFIENGQRIPNKCTHVAM